MLIERVLNFLVIISNVPQIRKARFFLLGSVTINIDLSTQDIMSANKTFVLINHARDKRAYDPTNLHPLDAADRKLDDASDGINWDEILATTQDDYLAGRFAFNSADYSTEVEAVAALNTWLDELLGKALDEAPALRSLHATLSS